MVALERTWHGASSVLTGSPRVRVAAQPLAFTPRPKAHGESGFQKDSTPGSRHKVEGFVKRSAIVGAVDGDTVSRVRIQWPVRRDISLVRLVASRSAWCIRVV